MARVMLVFGGGDEGGGPAYLKSYIKGIDKGRFEIVYISFGRDSLADELADHFAASEVFSGSRGSMLGAALSLRSAIARYAPDLIHTHGFRANFAGRLAGRACGIPVVTTVHSAISRDYANPLKGFLATSLDALTLPLTDRYIAISNAIKDDLVRRGVSPDKIAVIYNGVGEATRRLSRSEARKRLGIGAEEFAVGSVARLEPNKGIRYLVNATGSLSRRIAGLRVIIIGVGSERKSLEGLVKKLGLENVVIFCGFLPNAVELLEAFDVFAMPSLSEGFGLAAVEAMASRVPVVATRVGGLTEIFEDGKSGLLVEPGNHVALADAILSLYENRGRRSALAERAYEVYREKFTEDRFIAETERFLAEVCASEGASIRAD